MWLTQTRNVTIGYNYISKYEDVGLNSLQWQYSNNYVLLLLLLTNFYTEVKEARKNELESLKQ